jgi:hypothetical protein
VSFFPLFSSSSAECGGSFTLVRLSSRLRCVENSRVLFYVDRVMEKAMNVEVY